MEQTRKFKMGSLFDGSGGFPLASALCGIEPVWASEIEPFPIRVTKNRFPNMKHYGDISKINVDELEPVDLITGGSPCQDMSVAGKRQGMSKQCPKCDYKVVGNAEITECPECGAELEYTRSGLFMDQIRIVKEMREKDELEQLRSGRTDEYIRPRFMLWENVVGAFSSNKGEDFRAVLEETAKIADKSATIPRPPKGKWNNAGLIVGDGYSIAWRVLDAQYWGVPQRRRRIALVADFGGECAGEILFKREGLSRNFTESSKAWQRATRYTAESIGETSRKFTAGFCTEHSAQSRGIGYEEEVSPTLRAGVVPDCLTNEPLTYNGENLTKPLNKQNPQPGDPCHTLGTDPRNYVMIPKDCIAFEPGAASRVGHHTYENQCGALRAHMGDNQFAVAYQKSDKKYLFENHSQDTRYKGPLEISPTVSATYGMGGNNQPFVVHERKQYSVDLGKQSDRIQMNPDKSVTLTAGQGGLGVKTGLYCLPKKECIPFAQNQRDEVRDLGDKSGSLMAEPGMKQQTYVAVKEPVVTIPIQDQAISNGSGNGLGVGNENDPMYTLMADTQHGVAYSLQGNMIGREDRNGPQGSGINEDVSFTLNTIDRHAVAYGQPCQCTDVGWLNSCDDKSPTLLSRMYKDPHLISYEIEPEYIVRRLTPLECSRLQGFPDWWTDGLTVDKPNGHDIAFWREVFETHRKIVTGAKKPKTDKQTIKWLQEEPSDGAKYKMWGNGIGLPCFLYVLEGIKEVLDRG